MPSQISSDIEMKTSTEGFIMLSIKFDVQVQLNLLTHNAYSIFLFIIKAYSEVSPRRPRTGMADYVWW